MSMSNTEGLNGDEMLDHEQNKDIKALVEKRTAYNKAINAYAKIISLYAMKIDISVLSSSELIELTHLTQELRSAHVLIDPEIAPLLK